MADSLYALLTQRSAQADPRMAELIAQKKAQGFIPQDTSVEPMGAMDHALAAVKSMFVGGDPVQGLASQLTGNITYDPSLTKDRPTSDLENMLVHEGKHATDVSKRSILQRLIGAFGPQPYEYGQDPDELGAYQAENDYATSHGRSPAPGPNFNGRDIYGSNMRTAGDLFLPPDRKR